MIGKCGILYTIFGTIYGRIHYYNKREVFTLVRCDCIQSAAPFYFYCAFVLALSILCEYGINAGTIPIPFWCVGPVDCRITGDKYYKGIFK